MDLSDSNAVDYALQLVGELLSAEGESFAISILGGAALNLLGVVSRPTTDVDILAFASLAADTAHHPGALHEALAHG
jgi:hypothetical protein